MSIGAGVAACGPAHAPGVPYMQKGVQPLACERSTAALGIASQRRECWRRSGVASWTM